MQEVEKIHYDYNDFKEDMLVLAKKVKEFKPDILLPIARGGLTIGHMMGEILDNRNVYTINSVHYDDTNKLDTIKIFNIPDLGSKQKVLVIDDIIDSGDTMLEVISVLKDKYPDNEYKIASIFYKDTALIKPDYTVKETDYWVDFFWVADAQEIKALCRRNNNGVI